MKLSDKLSIDSIDYASQGNAILGIRNSGKSYTATFIAERLMDDGIPFIAFDPIGIWRYLKVGRKGAGYPVVVVVYLAQVVGGQLQAMDETLEVGTFTSAEVPWAELAFASTRDALTDYLARSHALRQP